MLVELRYSGYQSNEPLLPVLLGFAAASVLVNIDY